MNKTIIHGSAAIVFLGITLYAAFLLKGVNSKLVQTHLGACYKALQALVDPSTATSTVQINPGDIEARRCTVVLYPLVQKGEDNGTVYTKDVYDQTKGQTSQFYLK